MSRSPILFVDDDTMILELFSSALAKSCYPVKTARTGDKALEILKTEIPALLVVDIAMPLVSGADVLQAMRADPRCESTKAIILTAAPTRVSAELAALADRVVPKPISPKAFQQIVFELIEPC